MNEINKSVCIVAYEMDNSFITPGEAPVGVYICTSALNFGKLYNLNFA